MADLPRTPITRQEEYLSRLAGENTTLPREPITREEMYLEGAIARVEAVEEEVEEMKNNPDVVDIVATYADLTAYDKSKLTDKDVIRVLADETHNSDSTYYRYDKGTSAFAYIGESKQYTDFVGTDGQTAGTSGLVPAPATTDVDKFLKSDGTWGAVQAGPTVVQTIGTSTTDVMSQNAVSSMVFADPATNLDVRIGDGASIFHRSGYSYRQVAIGDRAKILSGGKNIAIGQSASIEETSNGSIAIGGAAKSDNSICAGGIINKNCTGSIAIGYGTNVGGALGNYPTYSVALGYGAKPSRSGEVNIGTGVGSHGYNSTNYRVLGGVHDPVDVHDAATKGYVDAISNAVFYINMSLSSAVSSVSGSNPLTLYKDSAMTQAATATEIDALSDSANCIVLIYNDGSGYVEKYAFNGLNKDSSDLFWFFAYSTANYNLDFGGGTHSAVINVQEQH